MRRRRRARPVPVPQATLAGRSEWIVPTGAPRASSVSLLLDPPVRVPVIDLVGNPGASRALARTVARVDIGDPTEDWGPADEALAGPIEFDLHLDAVVEGILVRGELAYELELPCSRCTRDTRIEFRTAVAELFQDPRKLEPGDEPDPGYELIDAHTAIDLETMVRDVVLLDLPMRVHCGRDDCAPPAAADVVVRSEDEHDGTMISGPDPRWAKLGELDVPES